MKNNTNSWNKFLSDEEVRILIIKSRNGDQEAREQVFNSFKGLSSYCAKDYVRPGLSFDECESSAFLGLLNAIDKFNPDKEGAKFIPYAKMVIRSALRDCTRTERLIPMSDYTYKQNVEIKKAIKAFIDEYEEEPQIDDIVDMLGGKYSRNQISNILGQSSYTYSLDARMGDDEDDTCLADYVGEDDWYDID